LGSQTFTGAGGSLSTGGTQNIGTFNSSAVFSINASANGAPAAGFANGIDLAAITVSLSGGFQIGDYLQLVLSDQNFTGNGSPVTLTDSIGAHLTNGTSPSVAIRYQSFVDATDSLWSSPPGSGGGPSLTFNLNSQSTTGGTGTWVSPTPNGAFSLVSVTTFTPSGANASVSSDGSTAFTPTTAVPEPASLLLLLSGVPMLWLSNRVRTGRA